MNPRVSRSRRWPRKATGFPIAKIAAKLAVGYRLHELPNDITRETTACFEPTIDYVVTKIPRFAFEKFPEADADADDADEERRRDDGDRPHVQGVVAKGAARAGSRQLRLRLRRQGSVGHAEQPSEDEIRRQARDAQRRARLVSALCLQERHERRGDLRADADRSVVPRQLARDRRDGRRAAERSAACEASATPTASQGQAVRLLRSAAGHDLGTRARSDVRDERKRRGIEPTFKSVDTCAAEFEAYTPYYYSTYEDEDEDAAEAAGQEADHDPRRRAEPHRPGDRVRLLLLPGQLRPARSWASRSIMVNSNPETVSTDYDTSDLLFFEPLTTEDVLNICDRVQPDGVIVQFGGQTPLNLARALRSAGVPIIGTSVDTIEAAEDREKFQHARRPARPEAAGQRHRPHDGPGPRGSRQDRLSRCWCGPASCSAAGRWKSATTMAQLERFVAEAFVVAQGQPVLIDQFLEDATEVDVDCISDGETVDRRRRHGAHRGGRHPLRRLGLRDSAVQPARPGDRRRFARRPIALARHLQRRRADERAVRGQARRRQADRLCAGSQPAGQPHGAVRRLANLGQDRPCKL